MKYTKILLMFIFGHKRLNELFNSSSKYIPRIFQVFEKSKTEESRGFLFPCCDFRIFNNKIVKA